MTTHEFDAHCDTQEFYAPEPDHHEQCLVMQEYYDDCLDSVKQQGAREALVRLRKILMGHERLYGVYKAEDGKDTVGTTSAGLAVAIQAVDALLQDTKVKGGAA